MGEKSITLSMHKFTKCRYVDALRYKCSVAGTGVNM